MQYSNSIGVSYQLQQMQNKDLSKVVLFHHSTLEQSVSSPYLWFSSHGNVKCKRPLQPLHCHILCSVLFTLLYAAYQLLVMALSATSTRRMSKKNESNEQQWSPPILILHWLLPQSNLLLSSQRPPHLHTSSDNLHDFVRSDGYKKSWAPSLISSFPSLTLNDAHARLLKR